MAPLVPIAAMIWRGKVAYYRWLVVACVISLISDGTSLFLSRHGQNNLWVTYLLIPLLYSSMLLALATGQVTAQERTTIRITAGLLLVVSAVLAFGADDLANFSRYSLPLGSLLLLSGALWILVRQGFGGSFGEGDGSGWFWIPAGLALFGALNAAVLPLVGGFISTNEAFVVAVFKVKFVLAIVAFCLIGWGILCQDRPKLSGPFSSRFSSPSRSS